VLRHWNPDHAPCPFVEEGSFCITRQGSAVIQRHIVRQHGVVIAGPVPHTLIDPVAPNELRQAVRDMLEQWWRPLLDDPAWLERVEKQPFAILTICRALYTLEQGAVGSKPVAARWTQQTLDERWRALIGWALASRQDTAPDNLQSTLRFIHYALDRCAVE
jgi:hypothetical protein